VTQVVEDWNGDDGVGRSMVALTGRPSAFRRKKWTLSSGSPMLSCPALCALSFFLDQNSGLVVRDLRIPLHLF